MEFDPDIQIYAPPRLKVVYVSSKDVIATSPLEDPEKGGNYDWDD